MNSDTAALLEMLDITIEFSDPRSCRLLFAGREKSPLRIEPCVR